MEGCNTVLCFLLLKCSFISSSKDWLLYRTLWIWRVQKRLQKILVIVFGRAVPSTRVSSVWVMSSANSVMESGMWGSQMIWLALTLNSVSNHQVFDLLEKCMSLSAPSCPPSSNPTDLKCTWTWQCTYCFKSEKKKCWKLYFPDLKISSLSVCWCFV